MAPKSKSKDPILAPVRHAYHHTDCRLRCAGSRRTRLACSVLAPPPGGRLPPPHGFPSPPPPPSWKSRKQPGKNRELATSVNIISIQESKHCDGISTEMMAYLLRLEMHELMVNSWHQPDSHRRHRLQGEEQICCRAWHWRGPGWIKRGERGRSGEGLEEREERRADGIQRAMRCDGVGATSGGRSPRIRRGQRGRVCF